jgi:spermidine/putrescine transport system substrate-binding protein
MAARPPTYTRRGVIAAGAALAAAAYAAEAHAAGTARTLRFYDWISYVHPRTYAAFTKATGIEVERAYYTSNEALHTRLAGSPNAYDLAVPTGYMVSVLAEEGLLRRIDWKRLPTVRKTIDRTFLGLPYDPKDLWSVPKDWGTTGFVYRTDKIAERPTTWAQFFALFKKHPRRFSLLDGPAEVVGSVAVMLGHSYNTDDDAELAEVERFLGTLRPYVRAIDSLDYKRAIVEGRAFGGMAWNGDGLEVIARTPKNAAQYVVAKEGGELWVDAYVVPRGARNASAAHAWIDFVYKPKNNAYETAFTYFGSPVRRDLLRSVLSPTILRDPAVFPPPATMKRLQPNAVTPRGQQARDRIWAAFKG